MASATDELTCLFFARFVRSSIVEGIRTRRGEAMEDIFVVKRCNKIVIHGRREGETFHEPAEASSWYRINDTRTGGFIGDGYDLEEDAKRECRRLNEVSSPPTVREYSGR